MQTADLTSLNWCKAKTRYAVFAKPCEVVLSDVFCAFKHRVECRTRDHTVTSVGLYTLE